MNPVAIWLIGINLFAFILYGLDKYRAKKKRRRISENALLIVALIGGALGAYAAMLIFRHKTKHPRFYIGVPVLLVAEAVLVVLLYSEII